ncbi:MAG: endonuclease/exonuclease/phosphatase family protein [Verrucomicrobiota bacterium]|nr:endonuclease/exonuclease/phosphatase family protein [Verrucomicrobiota bacterium]
MKWLVAILRGGAHAAAGLLVLCLALRLMHYDRDGRLLALHYATPWPVLTALALVLATFWMIARHQVLSTVFLLACLGCAGAWIKVNYHHHSPRAAAEPLRVVYWNVGGPDRQVAAVIDYLEALGADVIGIAERGSSTRRAAPMWNQRFAGKSVKLLFGGMMLIVNGQVLEQRSGLLGNAGRYNRVRLQVRGREVIVMLADLDSAMTRSRGSAFQRLGELVAADRDAPLIVMGDFNTSIDSPHYRVLRESLSDAFETAGRGFSETWPVPVPLLSLDHIWVNAPLRVANCQLGWSSLSDHRPVVAEIEFRAESSAERATSSQPGAAPHSAVPARSPRAEGSASSSASAS